MLLWKTPSWTCGGRAEGAESTGREQAERRLRRRADSAVGPGRFPSPCRDGVGRGRQGGLAWTGGHALDTVHAGTRIHTSMPGLGYLRPYRDSDIYVHAGTRIAGQPANRRLRAEAHGEGRLGVARQARRQ